MVVPSTADASADAFRRRGRASVLICVWNKLELTRHCLDVLLAERSPALHRIVVVDNGSTDGTGKYLAELAAAHSDLLDVLSPGKNLGFVRGNNLAAAHADGDYLVFLNNDTSPCPGWLDQLVRTAEEDPGVGAVGAKLVYPDGRLQEAGGIVFSDASGANYGNGDDPAAPRYAFPREVDYCSGACLLVRADLFRTLGGFDERYAPAYYEDTDLCFSLRELGYRVVYQPAAAIVHHEGGTAGTDPTAGAKRYQVVNRETFRQKWAARLAEQHGPETPHRLASDRAAESRILLVASRVPSPRAGGASERLGRELTRLRSAGNGVTLVAIDGSGSAEATAALRGDGVETYAGEPSRSWETAAYPFSLRRLLRDGGFDLALLSPAAGPLGYVDELRSYSPATRVVVAGGDDAPEDVSVCASLLAADDTPPATARASTAVRRSVLVVANELPTWDRSSGGFRLLKLVEAMRADGASVTFLARGAAGQLPAGRYIERLEALGVGVFPVDPQRLVERFGGMSLMPPLDLEALLRSRAWDTVYVYFHEVAAQYLGFVRRWAPGARVVVDSVDVHFLREQRAAALSGDPRLRELAARTKSAELGVYRQADAVVVVTEADRAALLAEAPELATAVIPNVHPIPEPGPGFAARRDLLFVGGFQHTPNVDGVVWFCREVWPLVADRLPGARLHLAGDRPPEEVRALASDRVVVHGYVADLEPLLAAARVSIAPLRYGAGMKGKVGEALAAGLPVAATTVAVEGTGLASGRELLVADDPAAFADAVVRLHEDESLWSSLAAAGRAFMAARYSPEAVRPLVRAALAGPAHLEAREHVAVAFADELLADAPLLDGWLASVGAADRLTLAVVATPGEVDALATRIGDADADALVVAPPEDAWALAALVERSAAVYSRTSPAGYEPLPRHDETTLAALVASLRARAREAA